MSDDSRIHRLLRMVERNRLYQKKSAPVMGIWNDVVRVSGAGLTVVRVARRARNWIPDYETNNRWRLEDGQDRRSTTAAR